MIGLSHLGLFVWRSASPIRGSHYSKKDYVRATKDAVIAQAISDVKFAAKNLKTTDAVKDEEVNSAAAYHLLSELYLATGEC